MSLPALRPLHWLLFALVALAFFAWGVWLMRAPERVEPLPWLVEWQAPLLTPLADERLTLSGLSATVAGKLWLQPRPAGPRLLYRAELDGGGAWRLEAELALSERERASLMAALGLSPQDAEQPLGRQLIEQLGRHGVAALNLKPLQPLPAERLLASLGQPRLRLELAEGEAWIYPQQGLTAHLLGDELQLLRVVPRRALQQP